MCEERARLAREGGVPHRIDGGRMLFGPFSLHERAAAGDGEGDDDEGGEGGGGGGAIPRGLYEALALVGMEDADEGPVVTRG